MLIISIKEKQISGARRGKPKQKRTVYEVEYEDGSHVVLLFLDLQHIYNHGIECAAIPVFCGECYQHTPHDYYRAFDAIKCRICGNKMGEKDTRPVAPVLQGDFRKAQDEKQVNS